MTRDELIKAIYDSDEAWSCLDCPCDLPEEEGNTGDCCLKCAEKQLAQYEAKVRAETIEFISDKLIYPLLDEYDRGLWEHIDYIELAEEWIKVLDDNHYPKVKNHIEARKRDLRRWIAEKLKEQKDE